MKKKVLKISIIMTVVFFLIATVAFFLMKSATPTDPPAEQEEEDVISPIVESIEFLKLNTYKELKAYADEYPIFIQESDDKMLFGVGELYIADQPVKLFYQTNEDGSLNRFDGYYTAPLPDKSVENVQSVIETLNGVIAQFFEVDFLAVDFYNEQGAPMPNFDESVYGQMLDGKATFGLTVMDEHYTYWYITAKVTDGQQVDVEFFRCFDATQYNVGEPNVDLRPLNETGE